MATCSTKWYLEQFKTKSLIDIEPASTVTVGRHCNANIVLRTTKASREHATIVVYPNGNLMVQDLKSVNGTFVNGTQIPKFILHRVFPGDIISFGMGSTTMALNDRDEQCFFKVLQIAEECTLELADSTTNPRKCSLSDSNETAENTTEQNASGDSKQLELGDSGGIEVIEIHDSMESVCDMQAAASKEEVKNQKHLKDPKKNIEPLRIMSRRPTVKTNVDELELESAKQLGGSNKSGVKVAKGSLKVDLERIELELPCLNKRRSTSQEASSSSSSNSRRKVTTNQSEPSIKEDQRAAIKRHTTSSLDNEQGRPQRVPNRRRTIAGELKSDKKELKKSANRRQSVNNESNIHINFDQKSSSSNKSIKKAAIVKKSLDDEQKKTKADKNSAKDKTKIDVAKAKPETSLATPKNDRKKSKANDTDKGTSSKTQFAIPTRDAIRKTAQVDASDKRFSANFDNSVIIDITDDNDDDMDFSSSQIFHMSEIVKTETEDDTYKKIKNELAEMDFCNEELVVNAVPIDLGEDVDNAGFENTQDICAVLEDGTDDNVEGLLSCLAEDAAEIELLTNPVVVPKKPLDKVAIIEPHTITKAKKPTKKSPKTVKEEGNAQKRKLSVEAPIETKKARTATRSPVTIKEVEAVVKKLKRRSSTSNEINKDEKDSIREVRRQKLKDLAVAGTSKSCNNLYLEFSGADGAVPEVNKGVSGCLGTRPVVKSGQSRMMDPTSVIQPPPPARTYNLRRAKSSDEIKLREKDSARIPSDNRMVTRHSACLTVSNQAKPDSNKDPPLENHRPIAKGGFSNRQPPQHSSNPLMNWRSTVFPPARRPTPRRLPNVDDITMKMVRWLPNWLQEQMYIDISAPVNNPPANEIPLSFKNFEQYYQTFSKLVLLENWQYLFKAFRGNSEKTRRVEVKHVRVISDMMHIDCVYYLSWQELQQGQFPRPEDFVLLECIMSDQTNCYSSCNFGLVQNCKKTIINNETIISVRLGDLCKGVPHMKMEFTISTRYQADKELDTHKLLIVKPVANVRAHLMLIRAIKCLAQSPLSSMILNPKMNDFKFMTTQRDIWHPNDLNPLQKTIVLEAASLCTGAKRGIYCVKGPPGTGKSTVIVNLLFQILLSHQLRNKKGPPPMILLAAPSNTAVDSLISKLTTFKYTLALDLRHHIKLVRIGPESSISREAIGYSLPKLAEKHVPIKNMELPEIRAARARNEDLVEFCKAFFANKYQHEYRMCENLIIAKSNIICTTLNSCINGRLIDAVNRGLIQFTCCIIDEATQCHEVEALLPTILGIDKLVLVGDPQQLNATIMNRDALKLGFDQSLFSRLANNFGSDPRSPIKMLTDQYRMHPEICAFPNKRFYEGKLKSFAKPANKLPDNIRPYLVFNLAKVKFSDDYTNLDEVVLIKMLLTSLFGMLDKNLKYTVAIITPYNAQKELISQQISGLMNDKNNCKIAINTVDSFQGSENDIVIISCVRDSSNSFLQNENRLNVALTRAKQALYIIGNYALFKECRALYDLREDAKKRRVLLDIKTELSCIENFHNILLK